MAIFATAQNDMDGVASLACDGTADIANLPAYAQSSKLKPGSSCLVIDTGELYMMKSNGTWKKLS